MQTESQLTESPNPQPQNPNDGSEQETRRSRSKISRLPSEVRERINQLLYEGLTYARVLEELGDAGKNLIEMDLSRWMHGPHNEWLERRDWLDHIETSYDAAKDIVKNNKAASIHEANLHLVATQMCRSMLGCDPARLPELVKEDPNKFLNVIQAIPRYAHQALNFQKYKDACTQARAELQKLRDPKQELSDEDRRAIVDHVDKILGLK